MNSLLNSLLLDNSSTICTIGLTMLVKLLPTFAFKACEELKIFLPRLFVILARVICWEELSNSALPSTVLADDYGGQIGAGRRAEEYGGLVALELRPELGWERLELRRNTSSAPPSDAYFSSLYYLFPCNLLRFVRGPAAYLRDRGYESPYVVGWEDALDEDNIRSKSEVCTPSSFHLPFARCLFIRFSPFFAAVWSIHGSYGGIGSRNLPNLIHGPTLAFLR